ncbi:MAG: hypothetical protein NC203_03335 [Firmicutes bacterium]|nr:hypothetical protein [[Eubacterium] siraeum]MCM1487378.1 hypothetical protein [Bacillota bacterium]
MKKKRQSEILSIIKEQVIENQEMLIKALSSKGYKVTQATVSRDINELRLEKNINENGISCYSQATERKKFDNIFQQAIISIDYAMNIVCLKCHSGLADAACAAFDVMNPDYVVGTIAGDDTVFILVRTEADARLLCEKLKKMI